MSALNTIGNSPRFAIQTVEFRYDISCNPAWQYHSEPESIVGGGATLDEARESYREALKFSLGYVPPIREFAVIGELRFSLESRVLADGHGGVSTNYRTGETVWDSKPCTRQSRWVSTWEKS